MKDYSASQLKKGIKAAMHALPQEGTRVRKVFDLLHAHKGHILVFEHLSKKDLINLDGVIAYLRLWYGLHIVRSKDAAKRCEGQAAISLIGETMGPLYISYVVNRPLKIKVKKELD